MFYFVYGSNMNHKQMKKRAPGAKFLGRAAIDNYKFVYDGWDAELGGAVGNIIPQKGSRVLGGLY